MRRSSQFRVYSLLFLVTNFSFSWHHRCVTHLYRIPLFNFNYAINMNVNFRNTLVSLVIITAVILLVYFVMVFPSRNSFAVMWLYFTYYIGFIVSIFAAIYYMFDNKEAKKKSGKSFTYNFTGTLNWVTAIAGLLLAEQIGMWLILLLFNLILGYYIYRDIYSTSTK